MLGISICDKRKVETIIDNNPLNEQKRYEVSPHLNRIIKLFQTTSAHVKTSYGSYNKVSKLTIVSKKADGSSSDNE